jgi:hypothetical protein
MKEDQRRNILLQSTRRIIDPISSFPILSQKPKAMGSNPTRRSSIIRCI